MEFPENFASKTFTSTILFGDGTIDTASFTFPNTVPSTTNNTKIFDDITQDPVSIEVYWTSEKVLIQYDFAITSLTLVAAKLEEGTKQTLATQDSNGKWILDDEPPNFSLELLKCMRYYQPIYFLGYQNAYRESNRNFSCNLNFSIEMRIAPTLSSGVICYANSYGYGAWKTGGTYTFGTITTKSFIFNYTLPESETLPIEQYRVFSKSGSSNIIGPLYFSAEF